MKNEIAGGYIQKETHKGICSIEFFHPHSNSLPSAILFGLAHTIHSAGEEEDVKVIVLRSGGNGAFCAGASFDELASIETREQGIHFFEGFAKVLNAMRRSNKIIIGRIHGKCVGGGVGIAAACDYAIAHESADVKLSELSIGIGPFVVGPAVERKIGVSAFSQLAIDSTMWRNTDWAKRKALYAEVHASIEGLDESISRLAFNLAKNSPEAMRQLKHIFWAGTEHWDHLLSERAAISGSLILKEESRNAIAAVKEKLRIKQQEVIYNPS